jgi:HAE1 family hydrophobic/amphiphilic exporter-1
MPGTELSDLVETLLASDQPDRRRRPNQHHRSATSGDSRQASADKLAAIGLTLADIRLAIQQTSLNLAKGALYGESSISTLSTNDQLFHPEDYSQLIVSYKDGAPVHLRMSPTSSTVRKMLRAGLGRGQPGVNLVISGNRAPTSSRPWTASRPHCPPSKPCCRPRCRSKC